MLLDQYELSAFIHTETVRYPFHRVIVEFNVIPSLIASKLYAQLYLPAEVHATHQVAVPVLFDADQSLTITPVVSPALKTLSKFIANINHVSA